jgi:hypothetical protein
MFSQPWILASPMSITGDMDQASRLGAQRLQAEAVPFCARTHPTSDNGVFSSGAVVSGDVLLHD